MSAADIKGGGGFGLKFIKGEVPSGAIDGVNKTFSSVKTFYTNTLAVYLNGLRLQRGSGLDYVEISETAFEMSYAPLPGDSLTIDYIVK